MAGTIIDLHSHFFVPEVLDRLIARSDVPRIVGEKDRRIVSAAGELPLGLHWHDLPNRLDHLERVGVTHQLLSWPTTLGLEPAIGLDEARGFWRAVNDGFGALVRDHPARFSALAAVSTADLPWSIAELHRAYDELGLLGLVLPINAFASKAGVRYLAPLLAEADRLGCHLYLHTGYAAAAVPGQPAAYSRDDVPGLGWTLAAMHHFASAFATVALTDALDAYPDLTVQIAMLGGAGAAALLLEQARIAPARFGGAPDPARLDRLFLDTGAIGQGPAAIGTAVDVLGPERIVFGSDYAPADDIAAVVRHVREAPIRADDLDAVLHANARRLLARHGVDLSLNGAVHVRA